MSGRRVPLWTLLMERGFCDSRINAEARLLAHEIVIDSVPFPKVGMMVVPDVIIREKVSRRQYASRGGVKLAAAIDMFEIKVEGRVALDAGASTGGFTDCLLQRGAARVYAVDTGFGQLRGSLRKDSRVVNMERRNIGSLTLNELDPDLSLITLDLSYLSLRIAVPIVHRLLRSAGDIICLVKPLFEIEDSEVRRSGIVGSREVYRSVLLNLGQDLARDGLVIVALAESPILGNGGTVEYLFHVQTVRGQTVDKSVADLVDTLRY